MAKLCPLFSGSSGNSYYIEASGSGILVLSLIHIYEDNADAHLKRTVMGREVVVAVTQGKLDFGTWEQIFYYELDGKRKKHALIKIIGE